MKKALFLNAAFSGLSGVLSVVFQHQLDILFAVQTTTPFLIIGVTLIFFSFTIVYEMKKLNKKRIIWIIMQDMFWVLGSIYFLLAKPFSISANGNILIAAIAILVLLLGINQTRALLKIDK